MKTILLALLNTFSYTLLNAQIYCVDFEAKVIQKKVRRLSSVRNPLKFRDDLQIEIGDTIKATLQYQLDANSKVVQGANTFVQVRYNGLRFTNNGKNGVFLNYHQNELTLSTTKAIFPQDENIVWITP